MQVGFLVFVIISLLILVTAYCVAASYIFDRLVRIEKLLSGRHAFTRENKTQNTVNANNISDKKYDDEQ